MARPAEDVKRAILYWEHLASNRSNWENMWQEIADNSLGKRDFTVKREPGRQRMVHIYDTTSRDSNTLLAAALHALLTNPNTNWFDIRFELDALNEWDPAVTWVDEVRRRMAASFSRPESGFTTQMHETYSDLTGFNTSCLFHADVPGFGPRFSARPLSEIYIDDDDFGRVQAVFRRFDLKAWQAVDEFGADAVPKAAEAVEKSPGKMSEYLHYVWKKDKPLPGRIDNTGMPWGSMYIDMGTKSVIDLGGFWENPYHVSRWTTDAGEIYGRGPGTDYLPEQKMLNAMWRTYIRNLEKAGDPPLLVDDDGIMPGSQLKVTPNARIVVRNDGSGREPVRYLQNAARLDFSRELLESRSQKIEQGYHSEIIKAFRDPRMTATQVIELARLSQRILSPVLGRMQTELLEPLIKRQYGILLRGGRLPPAPPQLTDQQLRIDYVSPVARAQRASESQAILDSFAAAAAMAEAQPEVMDNINMDEAVRVIFDANDTPVRVIRQRDNVIEIRRARAEAVEQQNAQQEALALSEAASKLIPALSGAAGEAA